MKKRTIPVITVMILLFVLPPLYAQSREEMRRKLNPTCDEVVQDFDKMMRDLDLTDYYGPARDDAFNNAIIKLTSFADRNFAGAAADYYKHKIDMKRRDKKGLNVSDYSDQAKLADLMEQSSRECQEKQNEIKRLYDDMRNSVEMCDFSSSEKLKKEILSVLRPGGRCLCPKLPDLGWIESEYSKNVDDRREELRKLIEKANKALEENRNLSYRCIEWKVPPDILGSELLNKCKPELIGEMKSLSEVSKRREIGFQAFKEKRVDAINDGNSSLTECRALKDSLNALNKLDPRPFETCAHSMLLQEHFTDPVDPLKQKIEAKIRDLDERWKKINSILSQTNQVIWKCDWNSLDRMKSDALRSLPEENCIRNYPNWAKARDMIYGLDRKKQTRLEEVQSFRDRLQSQLMLTEGYLKTRGGSTTDLQKTWEENVAKHYNYEKGVLDGHVREAHNQGYADCARDLIARANALPKNLTAKEQEYLSDAEVKALQKELWDKYYQKWKDEWCINREKRKISAGKPGRVNWSGCLEFPLNQLLGLQRTAGGARTRAKQTVVRKLAACIDTCIMRDTTQQVLDSRIKDCINQNPMPN